MESKNVDGWATEFQIKIRRVPDSNVAHVDFGRDKEL